MVDETSEQKIDLLVVKFNQLKQFTLKTQQKHDLKRDGNFLALPCNQGVLEVTTHWLISSTIFSYQDRAAKSRPTDWAKPSLPRFPPHFAGPFRTN